MKPLFRTLAAGALAIASLTSPWRAHAAHGIALYGEPQLPPGFTHFPYVNPQAPKGGQLTLPNPAYYGVSPFDKLNPFTLRGVAPPGMTDLVFDTLAVYSLDEEGSQYGLLAQDIQLAQDRRTATFRLNPRARFSDGSPVTAADVVHSWHTLTSDQASPRFRNYFNGITEAEAVDTQTVRFRFKSDDRELPFVAGDLPVFSRKWSTRADGSAIPFDELQTVPPLASGPYTVDKVDYARNIITYKRNPTYWGADLPTRKGTNNVDQITFKLYRDYELQVQAFKAGEFDAINEGKARSWCCIYTGARFDSGELVKKLFAHQNVPGMNGYVFNLRRDKFKDVRVRHALFLALDFQWVNRNIFYKEYKRPYSYFSNSDLAAKGQPTADELALLEPWRAQLDPAVFGPMVQLPDNDRAGGFRNSLIEAQRLFREAGWVWRDGALRNALGEPFTLNVQMSEGVPLPRIETFLRNIERMGVQVRRTVADGATTRKRMQDFDYDLTMVSFRESRNPAAELRRKLYGSEARRKGSENIIGVDSPVVDALIDTMLAAKSPQELKAAAGALDRILMHGYYVVPERYSFEHRVAYNTRLGYPDRLPRYYTPYEWLMRTWWDKTATPR